METNPAEMQLSNKERQPPQGPRRTPTLALRSASTSPAPRMQLGDNKQRRPQHPVSMPLGRSRPAPPPTQRQPPPAHIKFTELPVKPNILDINEKRYEFTIADLENKGSIGIACSVSQMVFRKTNTVMAVKEFNTSEVHCLTQMTMLNKMNVCSFIVKVYGYLVKDERVCLCMELMDSSMDRISNKVYKILNKRIPEEVLGMMTVAVISALTYLESEVSMIHSDIKPSNILVNKMSDFKLSGFDVCDHLNGDGRVFNRDVAGTASYMAPERINQDPKLNGYTTKSDVWSFGITLMELTLGSSPYGDGWSNDFQMLVAIVNNPPPKLLEDGRFSKMMQEFTSACVTKDTTARPNYHDLQRYKFFRTYYMAEVDVGMWLKTVIDPIS